MKKAIIAVIGLAALYAGGAVWVATRLAGAQVAAARQRAVVASMGEKMADAVKAIDPDGSTLKEACAGKLTVGSEHSIVEYAVKVPPSERPHFEGGAPSAVDRTLHLPGPELDAEDTPRLDGLLCHQTTYDALGFTAMDPPRPEDPWPGALEHGLELYRWSELLERAATWNRRAAALRYVAVSHFFELEPAHVEAELKAYHTGSSRYRTRVITFPDGQTVCEGSGRGRFETKRIVGSAGSAEDAETWVYRKLARHWAEAVLASPLDDLCQAGGKRLCEQTKGEIDAYEW